jgi:hypothetical protein
MLTFDAGQHAYFWEGVRVPNVTSILQVLYRFDMVDPAVLDAALARGQAVHHMCELYDLDDLDEGALTDDLRGYLRAYQRFLDHCTPNWTAIEQPVFHKALRYAGTPDRLGELFWQGKLIRKADVDIKTATTDHVVWGLQLAAYNGAIGEHDRRRFSLQLAKDGSYRMREWTDPSDWPVFVSLLTVKTWKERHKL